MAMRGSMSSFMFTITQLLLLSLTCIDAAHKLPASFPLCKRSDPEVNKCLRNAVERVIYLLKDGVRDLHVPPMDPLLVPEMTVGSEDGSVTLAQKFTNLYMYGLSNATVFNVSTVMHLPEHIEYILDGQMPDCRMYSEYELDGRILLLPIKGKGNCSFVFTNIKARLGPVGHAITKDGKQYFNVTDFKLDIYDIEDFKMQFDNLFDGDKTLGQNMNKILNENWKEMWSELKVIFEGAFGALHKQFSQLIFNRVPFEDTWQH